MDGSFLVNLLDRPDLRLPGKDGDRGIPGVPGAPVITTATGSTRFLGRDGERGPWVYYSERPAGDVIPMHKHSANRIEFLIEGKIEWHERGKEAKMYAAGTLSHVDAGIIYGYTVLEDAKILIIFDAPPGINLA